MNGFKGIHFQNLIMTGNKAGLNITKVLDGEWYVPVVIGEREKIRSLLTIRQKLT